MRWSAFVILAACKINFDPLGIPGDARDDGGDATTVDAIPDAAAKRIIQAVSLDTTSGNPITIDTGNGLAAVTPGNMVMVVCGALGAPTQCLPTSTPSATWQQLDPGSTLGVYVACDAPAITSITAQNGSPNMQMVVVEFAGVTASCFDTKHVSQPCPNGPAAWDTLPTMTAVSQAHEILVAVGQAGGADVNWTIDPPYTVVRDATGVNASCNVLVGYAEVNATPQAYSATGTVGVWQVACFTDVFAFRAQ